MAARILAAAALLGGGAVAQQQAANPWCGYYSERNTVYVNLTCVNGVIDAVTSAFFGTPLNRSFVGWFTVTDTFLAALTVRAAFVNGACRTPGGFEEVGSYTPPPSEVPGRR